QRDAIGSSEHHQCDACHKPWTLCSEWGTAIGTVGATVLAAWGVARGRWTRPQLRLSFSQRASELGPHVRSPVRDVLDAPAVGEEVGDGAARGGGRMDVEREADFDVLAVVDAAVGTRGGALASPRSRGLGA